MGWTETLHFQCLVTALLGDSVSVEMERWCEGRETPAKAERPPQRLRSSPEQPWGTGSGFYLWLLNSFMISRKPL